MIPLDDSTIDTDKIKREVCLDQLIEMELGQPAAKSGRWLMWWCPFHNDHHPSGEPSLAVTPDTGTYYCFGCGATGDVIEWVKNRRRLSFVEACGELGGIDMAVMPKIALVKRPERVTDPPSADWQARATVLVEECEKALWNDEGVKALSWLKRRGLNDETIRL